VITKQTKKLTTTKKNKSSRQIIAQSHSVADDDLRIFQIYYQPWQLELLDAQFIPLDNSQSRSELLELDVFQRLLKSDQVKGVELWGALSWRFGEKTQLSGVDLVQQIKTHPGYDVYYCNPEVINEALFHNLWLQGEVSHPDFLLLCRAFFEATDLPLEELTNIASSQLYSSTNSFVATTHFWQIYLKWITDLLNLANKKLSPHFRDMLHSSKADDRGLHKGATYVPFIVERLFPVFMKTAGKDLRGFKIALAKREDQLNVHLRLLRDMKDMAHKTKSHWLASCWMNYRNLYLSQVQTKDWCAKYLPTLSPAAIMFA
jgi:hypothetical protein